MTAPAAPIILVTTGHPTLHQHPGADGEAVHPRLGRLLQPRHTSSVELTAAAGIPWACDNDCFQGLDEVAFVRMLDRIEGLPGCLFVTVPDVVGEAGPTLESFDRWAPELERRGLPLGLVAQDGMSVADLDARADRLAALFIGGSTEWKEGPAAAELAQAAKRAGLWVHWGRVNTRRRFDLIVATGAADSFDGSKWARFRNTYLNAGLAWLDEAAANRRAAIAAGAAPITQAQEAPMSSSTREVARELAADALVASLYDLARGRRGYDLTRSRRQSALRKLEERAERARRDAELDAIATSNRRDLELSLALTSLDLEAALCRLADRLLSRWDTREAVALALDDARIALNSEHGAELRRPPRLADCLPGPDGEPPVRRLERTGGGRAR